jgi:hypothetical protein
MKASAKRETIRRYIEEIGVVPVVRAPSSELALRAAEAVLAGGISVFEITMTVPGAVEVIRELCERFRGAEPRRRPDLHRRGGPVHRRSRAEPGHHCRRARA